MWVTLAHYADDDDANSAVRAVCTIITNAYVEGTPTYSVLGIIIIIIIIITTTTTTTIIIIIIIIIIREDGQGQGYDVIICDSSDPVGPAETLFKSEVLLLLGLLLLLL